MVALLDLLRYPARAEGRAKLYSEAVHARPELGIAADRIDTVVDFAAIERYDVNGDGDGGAAAASAASLAELAEAISAGDLVVPIQRTYRLDDVRAAFTELEAGHIAGKIVLIPDA